MWRFHHSTSLVSEAKLGSLCNEVWRSRLPLNVTDSSGDPECVEAITSILRVARVNAQTVDVCKRLVIDYCLVVVVTERVSRRNGPDFDGAYSTHRQWLQY